MEKIRINRQKNEVRLCFNERFYPKKYIDMAVDDFGEACNIKESKGCLVLKPKGKEDISIIGYEFYNYVLGLVKNH